MPFSSISVIDKKKTQSNAEHFENPMSQKITRILFYSVFDWILLRGQCIQCHEYGTSSNDGKFNT